MNKLTLETFKPYQERILVKPVEPEEAQSKIFNPSDEKPRPSIGEIIKKGDGVKSQEPMPVYEGDRKEVWFLSLEPGMGVVFGKFAGTDIELDGERYLIMKDNDILGTF